MSGEVTVLLASTGALRDTNLDLQRSRPPVMERSPPSEHFIDSRLPIIFWRVLKSMTETFRENFRQSFRNEKH